MLEVPDVKSFSELVGKDLGTSDWHTVTQLHIDEFARATEDYEDLHVDPTSARARAFGGTVAHGLYTLSLGPKLIEQIFTVKQFRIGFNYGYDRVRFTSPVVPRCRLRLNARLEAADPLEGGVKVRIRQTFELEGQEKPACVATWTVAYYD